jgi:hypothetical protein
MNSLRTLALGALVASLVFTASAAARSVTNPFAGQWTTDLGGGVTGTVKFSVIDANTGASQLQAMGGHPCTSAPTTYYHGDYTDTGGSSGDTGTMTGCTASNGDLVGRYTNSNTSLQYPGGDIDITPAATEDAFHGYYTCDDPACGGMQFPYSGQFQSDFPGDGCCTSSGGGGGSGGGGSGGGAPRGWVIGGGSALYSPRVFCRVQRSFPPASDVLAPRDSIFGDCVATHLLSHGQKPELRLDAHAALLLVAGWCQAAGRINGFVTYLAATRACAAAVEVFLEIATKLVQDPPDRRFAVPPGYALPAPRASLGAITCPRYLTGAQCAALRATAANYAAALDLFTNLVGYVATGAGRVASAAAAKSSLAAFFQGAFGKVNEGALAQQAAALALYGKALAKLMRADHLDVPPSVSEAELELSRHPPHGVSRAQLKMIIRQLSSLAGTKLSAVLGSSIPASTLAAAYQSMSLPDLAAIVNGLVSNGQVRLSAGQKLANDLTVAQSVCTNASARISAMKRFVTDLKTYAPSEAQFLSFGAQPLVAQRIPTASCGRSAPPSFTGTWNTTYGPMQLTQNGNQVTGSYVICNGAATISGSVSGRTLDGTWTEPCDGGQGGIHFVLSNDGTSFTGLWGQGTNPPGAAWNGTRAY